MLFFKKQFNLVTKAFTFVLIGSFMFSNVFIMRAFARHTNNDAMQVSALRKYATDLTVLARAGRLQTNASYEREVNQLIKALADGNSRQPVILDEKGENQKLVVEKLAARIASGDVPANLKARRVLELELDSMFSNSKDNAEKSQIVADIIVELAGSKGDTILFIDELTNFVGAAQINNTLTDALLQGKVNIIGGSSQAAYNERIENTAELAAIFQPITVGDASINFENIEEKNLAANEGFRGDNVAPDLRDMMAQDPSGKKRIDVIIQSKDADNASLKAIMAQHKVRLQERIGDSDTLIVNLPLSAVEALAQSGIVNYLSPDRETKTFGHLEKTTGTEIMRSQPATPSRAAYTLDGTGIGIAVMDSGMLVNHKSFKNNADSNMVVYSKSFVDGDLDPDDGYGHGTHVAGIAAGNSKRNNNEHRGIAPNANIVNLKVLDNEGRGRASWLLSGLEWIKQNHQTYNIRVINLSLGGPAFDTYTNDPVCRKVQQLNGLGILVVAAAGNEGKNTIGQKLYGKIHSPGNDPSALTVGATNAKNTDSRSDDVMASFSSRGPTRSFYTNAQGKRIFDHAIKPDLVAPGNKIVSAKARSNSYMVTHYPNLSDASLNSTSDDSFLYMSGTSMATPVVAGAAALLFQQNPNLTPSMVKMILQYTAQPLSGYNMYEQGAGQLNMEGAIRLAKAYNQTVDFRTAGDSGMPLLEAGNTFPAAQSTLNGNTFNWSQGILTNHAYLKGQTLADTFHNVYKNNSWFEKALVLIA